MSGSWSTREATLHINHLEMLAVLYALRAFRVQLKGLTVQLMSDNASVVSYIRKQGGTVSVPLYRLTREVLILARDAPITLLAKHIPGERNALADLLSRMDKIVHTEWTLIHSADQIARGRRQSSRAVYDSKWRVFSGWCTGQLVNPFQVTIQKLSDFFVYLF